MATVTPQQALSLALQHHRAGRLAEAEALYRQILAVQPKHAEALYLLGVVAFQGGHHDRAVEWMRQALLLDPHHFAAHFNLGEALYMMGRLDEAISSFRGALQCRPNDAQTHYKLGNALKHHGAVDEAMAEYRLTLRLQPSHAEAHNNLGLALAEKAQFDEALAEYRRALEFKPDDPTIYNNLGNALKECGELDKAVVALRNAVQLNPNHPMIHNNLAIALKEQGQLDESIGEYRLALKLDANNPKFHSNLGEAYRASGQWDEAIACYRRALQLNPDHPEIHSNLIYALHLGPAQGKESIAEEQGRWNRQFADRLKLVIQPHTNDRNLKRRLRVGYVSPDFRDHVVGQNLAPLFRCHDHSQYEIFCYAGVSASDSKTEAFRGHSDGWRNTVGLTDEALAGLIRQDRVDILVDLTQHAAANRLPVFACRPAPVQLSFAGYPATTGLDGIGYRISDRYLESEIGNELPSPISPLRSSTQEQLCFIETFWCYDPGGLEVPVNELPAKGHGRVTFGSLNNFGKVNEPMLKLWAEVLGQIKDSCLLLLSPEGSHRTRVLEILASAGVEAQRVEFVEPRPRRAYLELYQRLDLALDPFPYNGHTTSLDALWMGVPVVSLTGKQSVSRAGYSQLSNLGLPELTAFSEVEYVRIATQLADDLPRLAELRRTLRARMSTSPLMDGPRFARNIESAYRTLWQRWCVNQWNGETIDPASSLQPTPIDP